MIELTDYQKLAIENLKTGSILYGGVGRGKSLTALGYFFIKVCGGVYEPGNYKEPKNPRDVYVITTAQKRDKHEWEDEAKHYLISTDVNISVCGIKLTIDSWNNIKKYTDVKNAFFIFDEQRLVGYGAWTKAFLEISKSNDWILLTATPGDQWTDYISVFVANGFYKNKSDFVRRHIIYKPFRNYPVIDRYVDEDRLLYLRDKITVKMSSAVTTVRHEEYVKCLFDKKLYDNTRKNRWNYILDEPIENSSSLCQALRRIVNADSSRIEELKKLVHKHTKTIIFYNYNYELELIKELLDKEGITYSEWNGHRHEKIPNGSAWAYVVQYTAGCEGWNCIETDTIIFYSLNYSYRVMEQAAGRIERMNTPFRDLYFYYLRTYGTIDGSILRCINTKKDFNEREYAKDEF